MIERLIVWTVGRYLGGPGRNWLFSGLALAGYRFARSRAGKQEIVQIESLGKGANVRVDHVSDTHHRQLKAERRVRRDDKRQQRTERRDRRRVRRAARAERRQERRDRRAAKAAAASDED